MIQFESLFFFLTRFHEPKSLQEFRKEQKTQTGDVVRDYKSRMFDAFYDITGMVEQEIDNMKKRNEERQKTIIIEAERKALEEKEIPPEIADSLRRFQGLVNSRFERSLRLCLERSLILLDEQHEMRLQQFYEKSRINPNEKSIDLINYEDLYRFQQIIEFEKVDMRLPLIRVRMFE